MADRVNHVTGRAYAPFASAETILQDILTALSDPILASGFLFNAIL